ncbi:MAG: hypothetical protein ACRD3R_05625 [Terriglobales bacterium]
MTPSIRKLALTAHITTSVGWLGALGVFFAHALASLISQDDQIVRAASLAMGITAWFVIAPLSLASLTTGLVQALGTAWGLFRHYWILFKPLLTAVATIVLLLKLEPISYLAHVAAQPALLGSDAIGLRTSLMVHAAGGLFILLAAAVLAVFKPAGMTRYGVRKQRERSGATAGSGLALDLRTPAWVKVFGIVVVVLILLLSVMMLVGGHGPAVHTPSR